MLQIFQIDSEFRVKAVAGELLRTRAHDCVYGAYTYEYRIPSGLLLLAVMNRKLHEVTYACPSWLPWVRVRRRQFLMQAYGADQWRQVLAAPSGRLYQSTDDKLFASWSKTDNATSFGTMVFYEEKYRIVT